ncbi:MAG: endonuclease/exonuclease/phosphatase family protein [Clostridia bacterium]|nr:endonuclease/exonuclease/phosphatase family protein [Clostridia bacterium]
MAATLKVFTFNLRVDVKKDEENWFWNRTGRVLDVIAEHQPDLIGFQEVTGAMRSWLKKELRDYTVLGCGRNADYGGEAVMIAYRTDRFDLISFDHRWLSNTPNIPGSRYGGDQSGCPRTVCCATLKHPEAGELLHFYNTHLDHQGNIARILGATQLMQEISARGGKFVLTGDFNDVPSSEAIRRISECSALQVVDATAAVGGTFHGFGRVKDPQQIVYIFTNAACDPSASHVITDVPVDGVYISDHNPVCAYITIE